MKTRDMLIISLLALLPLSCGVYSFTGASIDPETETISIGFFDNVAGTGPQHLSQTFTDALQERFVSQTNLKLVERNGDLDLQGAIVSYKVDPASPSGPDQSALNRLTIKVRAEFTNNMDETDNWEQTFSQFADFPQSQSLSAVEDQLIGELNERLVNDIFNKSVVNW